MATDLEGAKERLCAEVDRRAERLVEASHDIWEHPELNFEEHHAHDVLTAILEDEGVDVERSAYDVETAFAARAGSEGPTVAVLCEYDALPEIGHACGHNIIGTAGLGAGLAAAALADEAAGRAPDGRVTVRSPLGATSRRAHLEPDTTSTAWRG